MSDKILVIGATGRVGRQLVRLLTEKGETVRAATRSLSTVLTRLPSVTEAVEFDFEQPETFAPALKGVAKIFLIARPGDNHADKVAIPFIDMAKTEGIRLIVNLTAMGVERDNSFMLRILERYIEASEIPYVHLRPNWFMQNFNSGPMLEDIRNTGGLHLPASDAKLSFIDVRDIASVALAALTEPHHAGNAYTLTGGIALDHYEIVDILSRIAGKTIAYVPLSEEVACTALNKAGVAGDLIDRWTKFYRIVRQGLCAAVTSDVELVLGRPPISFEQYAHDHSLAWR